MNHNVEENKRKLADKNLQKPERKPNESGGFYFSSHLKISDPNTKEILVQKRGDN
jgi:hypothetical protein